MSLSSWQNYPTSSPALRTLRNGLNPDADAFEFLHSLILISILFLFPHFGEIYALSAIVN